MAVWALSLNFLYDFTSSVIDIHQNRSISPFLTPFNHYHLGQHWDWLDYTSSQCVLGWCQTKSRKPVWFPAVAHPVKIDLCWLANAYPHMFSGAWRLEASGTADWHWGHHNSDWETNWWISLEKSFFKWGGRGGQQKFHRLRIFF